MPLSLCHIDGSICKTNKSKLLHSLEQEIDDDNPPETIDVMIFDGFFMLYLLREVPQTFGSISKKLLKMFTPNSASTIVIAFDRYVFPSIKDNEHDLRGTYEGAYYDIRGSEMKRSAEFAKELKY